MGTLKYIQHDFISSYINRNSPFCIAVNKTAAREQKRKLGPCPENPSPYLTPVGSYIMRQLRRLDQIVLQYAHNEWSSPGFMIIGLSSLTSQLEDVQAEKLQYAMATKKTLTRYLPRPEVHSTHNFHSCFQLIWVHVVIQRAGFYTCPYSCKLHYRLNKVCQWEGQ